MSSPKTAFYFVRHGESEANAAGVVAYSSATLTEKGFEQAKVAAHGLEKLNNPVIICSPYIRAVQTAQTIAGHLGIDSSKILQIDELRERYLGECEGKPKTLPSEYFFVTDTDKGFEPQAKLIARLQVAVQKISAMDVPGDIIVVGHAVSGFYLTQVAKGYQSFTEFDEYIHMDNADYIKVEVNDD
jgi:broad specificity phosphatase PhoE